MSVKFQAVRFRNFLSTGEETVEVPLKGATTTLIVGKNGSGKSQFLDALSITLFNKPFRRINKGQLVNSITGKNCICEVEFERAGHSYLVRRGIKPNLIEIYQDGEQVKKLDNPEEYIERVIGMNQKSFFQVVVLGAALYVPFMQLKVPERRAVVEDLLDLQVFTVMGKILKQRITDLQDERQKLEMDLAAARIRVEAEQRHLRLMQEDSASMINAKLANITEEETKTIVWERRNVELKETQQKLERTIVDEREVITTLRKLEALDVQIQGRVNTVNTELNFYSKHNNCPTCKQAINSTFRIDTIASKTADLEQYETGRKQLLAKIEKMTERVQEINGVKNLLLVNYNEQTQNKHFIYTSETIIKNIKEEIERLQAKTEADIGLLNQYKADVDRLEFDADERTNERAVMDAGAELLKDEGVRAQVIKKYLPVLNKLINHYLAQMEFMCHLELDENFNETIKSRFRDDFSYESFSEGEKMRIDLSVLFAWRTIGKLRNSSSANLLVFDEVLDSSLDQDGADEFLKIVNNLTEGENVLVISHRGDQLVDKFQDVIRFDKNQGFSVASRG